MRTIVVYAITIILSKQTLDMAAYIKFRAAVI